MFLGSAARAVLFNAPCSALIVRGTKMVAGEREQRVAVAT